MRIRFDPRAAVELEAQIGYLIERDALVAAARLKARCDDFFETFLAHHPRTGKFIAERQMWEIWIPGTRLVVCIASDRTSFRSSVSGMRLRIVGGGEGLLQIAQIWHAH